MRILVYCNHLIGLGHVYRMMAAAAELATEHEVVLATDREGQGVSFPIETAGIRRLALEPVRRDLATATLAPWDASKHLEHVLADRRGTLSSFVRDFRPALVVIEFYPFERWEFEDELLLLIEETRRQHPGAKVVCSVRDVVIGAWYAIQSSRSPGAFAAAYADRVVTRLNESFDALWVHGDPKVLGLADTFPAADRLTIPVHHTGYVSRGPSASVQAPRVIVSAGGGVEGRLLLETCAEAWKTLRKQPRFANEQLLMLAGPMLSASDFAAVATHAGESVVLARFRSEFFSLLASATCSISRGGYNTVVNLLECSTPALIVPSSRLVDQTVRAERLAALGLLAQAPEQDLGPEKLAHLVAEMVDVPRRTGVVDLGGARETRRLAHAQ